MGGGEYLCAGVQHAANVGADAVLDVMEGAVVPLRVPGVPTERLPPRRRRRGRGDRKEEEDAEEEGRRHGRRGEGGAGNPLDRGFRGASPWPATR